MNLSSPLSLSEEALMNLGQKELASLLQTLRLRNPYPYESPQYLLWQEQSQINIPILIQASLFLNDFCQKHKKQRVLFTSRDSCHWIQIFQKLFPHYDSIYFHASRFTYLFPSQSYIEYVRSVHNLETVIVDSHGKGDTCSKFFKKHLGIHPIYLAIVNRGKKNHAIYRVKGSLIGIEKLNYDLCGTLYGFQDGRPLRCDPEYDLEPIHPMHECVNKCIQLITHYKIEKFDMRALENGLNSIKSGLILDQYVRHAQMHMHFPLAGGAVDHLHFP